MPSRIYLVEDNPVIAQWLVQALEELAHARVVGSAATQAQAREWLNTHPGNWDAAVIDLWLAQGNGIQVIECLSALPAQKIVVLTNYPTRTCGNCAWLPASMRFLTSPPNSMNSSTTWRANSTMPSQPDDTLPASSPHRRCPGPAGIAKRQEKALTLTNTLASPAWARTLFTTNGLPILVL
jgi:ActR/RegA family two-component response regulator